MGYIKFYNYKAKAPLLHKTRHLHRRLLYRRWILNLSVILNLVLIGVICMLKVTK